MQPTEQKKSENANMELFQAAHSGDAKKVKDLISGENINSTFLDSEDGALTALHIACGRLKQEVVKVLLLKEGVDVSMVDGNGKTPLLTTASSGYDIKHENANARSIIQLLIIARADRHAVDNDGNNALHLAIKKDRPGRIKGLIDLEIDVNAKNKKGETPLHIAISSSNFISVKALLNGGADHLLVDKNKKNYLHFFASTPKSNNNENNRIVNFLIKKGVDIKAVDIEGKTVTQIARDNGNTFVIDIIEAELSKNPLYKVQSWLDKNINEEKADKQTKTMLVGASSGSVTTMSNLGALGNYIINPNPTEVPPAKFSPRAGVNSSWESLAGVSSSKEDNGR
jgi:ankyrin repeat protein